MVTFKEAIGLKHSGFNQPAFELGQFWYRLDDTLWVVANRKLARGRILLSVEGGRWYPLREAKEIKSEFAFAPNEYPRNPNLIERINAGLDRELKRQKESGKAFISDEAVDALIDKIIKEEASRNHKSIIPEIQKGIDNTPSDVKGLYSDGYHTFNELYEFRKAYNAALFNEWGQQCIKHADGTYSYKYNVHKSLKHNDGGLCFGGGWFIVVAMLPTGQITNHYELKDWDLFQIPEMDKAQYEFDGHTPADVLARLMALSSSAPVEDQVSTFMSIAGFQEAIGDRKYFYTNYTVMYDGIPCRITKGLNPTVRLSSVPDIYEIEIKPENSKDIIPGPLGPSFGTIVSSDDPKLDPIVRTRDFG